MKKIQKLSLNRLTKKELNLEEMNRVKGGTELYICGCGCCYEGTGSLNADNRQANCESGLHSPEMCHGPNTALCPVL